MDSLPSCTHSSPPNNETKNTHFKISNGAASLMMRNTSFNGMKQFTFICMLDLSTQYNMVVRSNACGKPNYGRQGSQLCWEPSTC